MEARNISDDCAASDIHPLNFETASVLIGTLDTVQKQFTVVIRFSQSGFRQ